MKHSQPVTIRAAGEADLAGIAAVAVATGQDEDWANAYPAYLRHLIAHGTLLVAEPGGEARRVAGFGGTVLIGAGPTAICMLTDLFVHPVAHGSGIGRALLRELWRDQPRKMTFSSLHSHALPLYTSFGLDAWWPLLYLRGDVRGLPVPDGWSVTPAGPGEVAELERSWTGLDRRAGHDMWTARPGGAGVIARLAGRPLAAGSVGGAAGEYGISHLAADLTRATDQDAAGAVLAVLASCLDSPDGRARVCLPAPHPATRPLLAAGWQVEEFDLHMASAPGLIDPLRLVPSPALA